VQPRPVDLTKIPLPNLTPETIQILHQFILYKQLFLSRMTTQLNPMETSIKTDLVYAKMTDLIDQIGDPFQLIEKQFNLPKGYLFWLIKEMGLFLHGQFYTADPFQLPASKFPWLVESEQDQLTRSLQMVVGALVAPPVSVIADLILSMPVNLMKSSGKTELLNQTDTLAMEIDMVNLFASVPVDDARFGKSRYFLANWHRFSPNFGTLIAQTALKEPTQKLLLYGLTYSQFEATMDLVFLLSIATHQGTQFQMVYRQLHTLHSTFMTL